MEVSTSPARVRLTALLLLGILISGCGTSDYNAQVKRGAARLRSQLKFQGLYAPTQIPDSPYAIRVPVIFTESYKPDSGHPDDGETINKQRMQPPFFSNDDPVKLMYEGTYNTADGKKLPYYCYLAAGESKAGDADKLAKEVESNLKKLFPEAPGWEEVDADSPDGRAIHWRKLRTEFPQPFFVKVDGKVEKQTLPGIFELWMRDEGDHIVLVGWRTPKEIEGPQENDVNITAGIALPADNAKPDFSKWPVLTAGTLETQPAG